MSKEQEVQEVQEQEVQVKEVQEVQVKEVQDQEVQEVKDQDHNTRILKIWNEKGVNEAVKQMFVHPTNGTKLDYAEMRAYYG